jgi:SNF2 family DNA or RNA helicase
MIFFTFSYAYLEYNQSIGRIYRVGQKKPCTVYALINKGTAERKIWSAVQKAYDMDTLFKELMSGGYDG